MHPLFSLAIFLANWLLPEQDKLVGLEPVGDCSLLHVEVLVLGRLGDGGQEGEQVGAGLPQPAQPG